MKLAKTGAEIFIPDVSDENEAIARTTRMCIAAHQDDIEIMAYHGILNCFGNDKEWLFAVVTTDGAGSSRNGIYENYTDQEMQAIRRKEQKKAAVVGDYGALALLNYTSKEAKDSANVGMVEEFSQLILAASPNVIYTHNIADKHDTHVSVALKTIAAIRMLPLELRPQKLYGCEAWRSLDWLDDGRKVRLDVSAHPNISAAVIGVFDSQVMGGKRYDLAVQGRRAANAVFAESHASDKVSAEIYAMDLTPLITNNDLDISDFIKSYFDYFMKDVYDRLKKHKPVL